MIDPDDVVIPPGQVAPDGFTYEQVVRNTLRQEGFDMSRPWTVTPEEDGSIVCRQDPGLAWGRR